MILRGNMQKSGVVFSKGEQAAHVCPTGAFSGRNAQVQEAVSNLQTTLQQAGIGLNNAQNGFPALSGHLGTHTNQFLLNFWGAIRDSKATGGVVGTFNNIVHSLGRGVNPLVGP